MSARDNEAEVAAARHVTTVIGGSYEINDTGSEPGQYDAKLTTTGGRVVAMEVTSFGGDRWKQTRARIAKERGKGRHAGADLANRWLVVVVSGGDIRELEGIDELLGRLEAAGVTSFSRRYDGEDSELGEIAEALGKLDVNSANVWGTAPEADDDEPRVLVVQSERVIGTMGSLAAAVTAVFSKSDNQTKLKNAKADERHLYVFMEDGGASAVLQGAWPFDECPPDPQGVIDTLWIYSPSMSAYIFRVQPGTAEWQRFVAATGARKDPD